jgi:hypothetical protein
MTFKEVEKFLAMYTDIAVRSSSFLKKASSFIAGPDWSV